MALPADVPVGALLAGVVEGCEEQKAPSPQEAARWRLEGAGGPLEPRASLFQAGVREGAVLRLRRFESAPAGEPAARPAAGATLPEPMPLSGRLRAAVQALMSARPLEEAGPGESAAQRLSLPRSAGAVERVQSAWTASDHRRRLDEAIRTPRLNRCATIAVVSPKGGVGKTTTSIMLGTLLAMVRSERVVAIDTNPDHGTLGRSLAPEHPIFVDDILEVIDQPALTVTMLDRCLARSAHGMLVLPAPNEPQRMDALDGAAYDKVIRRLQEMASILVLDCGAGMQDPVTRAAMAAADQLVLVTDADPATAGLVADVARRLPPGTPYVLVVNKLPRRGARLDLQRLAGELGGAAPIVAVEADSDAAGALVVGDFTWEGSPPAWQVAIRELAAHLAGGWSALEPD